MGNYGTEVNDALAAELRAERARQKITVAKLVGDSGISKSAILNYLNGKREIPVPAFMEMCRALNANPRTVLARALEASGE